MNVTCKKSQHPTELCSIMKLMAQVRLSVYKQMLLAQSFLNFISKFLKKKQTKKTFTLQALYCDKYLVNDACYDQSGIWIFSFSN